MASPYKLDQIVEEWKAKFNAEEEAFEEMMKAGHWKNYDFTAVEEQGLKMTKWEELDEACHSCIFRHINQYKEFTDFDQKEFGNKFTVPCRGIPKNYIKDEVFEYLNIDPSSQEATEMKAIRDPVLWIEQNCILENSLAFEPRWYQKIMIRCTSARVVFRCGRRAGKTAALGGYITWAAITQPFYVRHPETGDLLLDKKTGQPIKDPTKILILTPRQTHADNIMDTIKGFIDRNPVLKQTMVNFKKNPYYVVEFTNGSRITCLTAGTGTAGAGMSARSFSANVLVLDEANYLGEPERKAIMAILSTNPNTVLRASSTPLGMQDFFYEWCFRKPSFKAFHFPTPVLPHWGLIRRLVYGDVETEDEFLHEYMADFSPSAMGVYRPDLVDDALSDYTYEQVFPNPDCMYGIGVDWNTNTGTEIFIKEYNPKTQEFKSVDAVNVAKSQWTQLNSLTILIEQIKKWDPVHVTVDEGHGNTQIELLLQYAVDNAKEHPAIAKLPDTLISYNFSSKIDVAHPITGEIKKKDAKPFLVQNSVRRMEEGNLILSKHDTTLLDQIKAYQIKSKSGATGRPTYGPDRPSVGDHRLDAWMLSLIGFKLKFANLDIPYVSVGDSAYVKRKKFDLEGIRSRRAQDSNIKPQNRAIPLGSNNLAVYNDDESHIGNVPSREIILSDRSNSTRTGYRRRRR